jgi:hypothetical protein
MSAESLATASLLASSGACLKKDCAQGGKPAPKKEEDYTGIIKRTRPLTEVTRADVTLVEFSNIDCDGAPIVDAFPSTGVVSVLAGTSSLNRTHHRTRTTACTAAWRRHDTDPCGMQECSWSSRWACRWWEC